MELFTKEHDKVTGQYRGFPIFFDFLVWRYENLGVALDRHILLNNA